MDRGLETGPPTTDNQASDNQALLTTPINHKKRSSKVTTEHYPQEASSSAFGLLEKVDGSAAAWPSASVDSVAAEEVELTPSHRRIVAEVARLVPGLNMLTLRARLAYRSAREVTLEEATAWLTDAVGLIEARFGREARFTDVVSYAAQNRLPPLSALSAEGLGGSGSAACLPGGSAAEAASGRSKDDELAQIPAPVNTQLITTSTPSTETE